MAAMSSLKGINDFALKMHRALGGAQEVHVGFMQGSTAGWNGPRPKKPGKAWKRTEKPSQSLSGKPAAYIAAIMEYGDPKHNIPPRPFFSTMVKEKGPTWGKLVSAALQANGFDSSKALNLVGLKVKEQLQLSIAQGNWAELADATKERKGFDTPLIDSHNMINSVEYVVT